MQSKLIQDVKRNEMKTGDLYGGEVGINRTPSNNLQDDIFTNLVKDSVSAHGREGIRPMFVNNYGDQKQQKRITKNSKASTHRQIDHTQRCKQLFHLWVKMINLKTTCRPGFQESRPWEAMLKRSTNSRHWW